MPADDLIAELEEAAAEFNGFPDFRFSELAREDLAAFRESRQREQVASVWSVPERYVEQAEEFIVFSAFVRAFLSPILTARGALELFREVGGRDYAVLRFARYEDTAPFDMPAGSEALGRLRDQTESMMQALMPLGKEIFGQRFAMADFADDGQAEGAEL